MRELVTVIGHIVNPSPGEVVKMKGEGGNHPKYGEQFKLIFCQTTTPATVYGIEKYLGEEAYEVKVLVDDREIAYDYSDLDELVQAYAVSIHKSQGSEYPAVVIPILIQHYILLQRNLLYTGVTRGKKLVVLVGTKKAMAIAVKNDKTEKRYTRLRGRLVGQ